MSDDLEAAIDRLYQLPPAEFTAARNALATARKTAGDKEGFARVKELARPSAVAGAVNQLFWRDREVYDHLVSALAEVAAAQREALTGGTGAAVREAMRRKSDALASAARQAERRLVESGGSSSPAILQRLTATLTALASPRAADATAPRPGRLTAELQASGFDVALGLDRLDLPPAPRATAKVSPLHAEEGNDPEESAGATEAAAHDEREALRRLAEADVARARRAVETAVQVLGVAEARAAAARADVDTLAARLEETRARASRQDEAERAARSGLAEARAALAVAEAALETAGHGPP